MMMAKVWRQLVVAAWFSCHHPAAAAAANPLEAALGRLNPNRRRRRRPATKLRGGRRRRQQQRQQTKRIAAATAAAAAMVNRVSKNYSSCSQFREENLCMTVKRVRGSRVANNTILNDSVRSLPCYCYTGPGPVGRPL